MKKAACFVSCFLFLILFSITAKASVLDVIYSEEGADVSEVLAYELSGGGFNYAGDVADSDTTAMVLQYLAAQSLDEEGLAAYYRGWEVLMTFQTEDGDYLNYYGQETSETTAQVILAMVAGMEAGIYEDTGDLAKAVSALKTYYATADGYAHVRGGAWNQMATNQATQAMEASEAYIHTTGDRQDSAENGQDSAENGQESTEDATDSASTFQVVGQDSEGFGNFLIILGIALILAGIGIILVSRAKNHKNSIEK